MFSGLLIIVVPLILGYLIPLRKAGALRFINQLLSWLVYIILFFMGISLAFLDDLSANLLAIFHYSAVSITVIMLCNIAALLWLERTLPWRHQHHQEKLPSRLAMALESLKLCGVVVLGFVLGLTGLAFLKHATAASEYTLIFLLFLIGIQLRNNGMTLRQIVLNRRGMMVAVVVLGSSLIAGVVNALLLGLPLRAGLAMASGFGWYSLSGILMTESYGPVIGSAAFFNDLGRELIAIMLIPTLVRRSRSTALGICGATSMDFTLPVLQRSGGLELVPAAIVHGFILSLLVPLLMALFAA
ncbi:lysine exporter LysO family protein [Cronobacter dublinensis]|uniref:lysine exporter LysO family protein n=1 Tax=Cronobacter dublinensis TaxID=413497 RepID=UPI000CFDDD0D|nr:lysine exporter LysO family protein [Cronobacter dublinensis]EGT5661922.1 lysine exporter LysO family protein [Cronobacter dublinensis subsp. dublinensis]EGT5668772.1 lysine exporter LysO family protein [Cronobacter dublinensis subsp. dublinensis]EGT5673405.1 lysine exporter LysO family protein [Cronobacter dublinensis subsp. dublinensis]EGT5678050.1 lysine exporter LysO family protein [Cronobacter dublinensis subsp. dublinensis]EGT5685650.1 lysine exporter LysO family protein [Cronobacter 